MIPAEYEYLKDLDLNALEEQVDWFSILAYDLHGPWDFGIPGLGPNVKPHTDLREIDAALELLWSAGVTPAKVNLGLANYGRGYTVADRQCSHYGCRFTGPSRAGSCTKQTGVLSTCEIRRIVAENNLTPKIMVGGAGIKEISWEDQWVGFDDKDTFGLKLKLANNRCLGGTALWAIDYETCDGVGGAPQPGSSAVPPPSVSPSIVSPAPPTISSQFPINTFSSVASESTSSHPPNESSHHHSGVPTTGPQG